MIDEIIESILTYKKENGKESAIQVSMHPSVFYDCLFDGHDKIRQAFGDMCFDDKWESFFGCELVVTEVLGSGEYRVEQPTHYDF